jgi:hypothetical protein
MDAMHPSAAMVWIGGEPAPRLGKKDKPLRIPALPPANPKKPDPSLL